MREAVRAHDDVRAPSIKNDLALCGTSAHQALRVWRQPAASAIDFHALSGVDRRRSRFTVSRPIELRSCMRSVPELIVTLRTRNGDPKSGSAAVLAFLRRADMTD